MTEDGTGTDSDNAAGSDGADLDARTQRSAVRDRYGGIASESSTYCGEDGATAGDTGTEPAKLGYSEDEVEAAAAELSLGCGNPKAIADLEAGETVLDLGSGGGFDSFLAADAIGEAGRVIGVDMTPEMIETARENAETDDADNVEFRLGGIEHLPVADRSVDVIISNCVVNLSPEKPQVFREAYRVLRPGGRVAISDVVLTADRPALEVDPSSVAACVAGAATVPALEEMLSAAGFVGIEVTPDDDSEEFIREWDRERDLSEYIVSARIEAEKPHGGGGGRQ